MRVRTGLTGLSGFQLEVAVSHAVVVFKQRPDHEHVYPMEQDAQDLPLKTLLQTYVTPTFVLTGQIGFGHPVARAAQAAAVECKMQMAQGHVYQVERAAQDQHLAVSRITLVTLA